MATALPQQQLRGLQVRLKALESDFMRFVGSSEPMWGVWLPLPPLLSASAKHFVGSPDPKSGVWLPLPPPLSASAKTQGAPRTQKPSASKPTEPLSGRRL